MAQDEYTASQIIEALGGVPQMMKNYGLNKSTAQSWKKRGISAQWQLDNPGAMKAARNIIKRTLTPPL